MFLSFPLNYNWQFRTMTISNEEVRNLLCRWQAEESHIAGLGVSIEGWVLKVSGRIAHVGSAAASIAGEGLEVTIPLSGRFLFDYSASRAPQGLAHGNEGKRRCIQVATECGVRFLLYGP